MPSVSALEWQAYLSRHPEAHLLQQTAWGELKARFGWQVERILVGDAGSQVLFRKLPFNLSIAYIPKGPVGSDWAALWPEIDHLCRAKHAVLLKVEPDAWAPLPEDFVKTQFPGFQSSQHAIQPLRTVLIDLDGGPDEIITRMKQKTRYNIRLAQKKGIEVHASTDFATFHKLMAVTGKRDGFGVHSKDYYCLAHQLFASSGACSLLQAEYGSQPLAALMVFSAGNRAWYLYGASNDLERNRMPTYLLQWHAIEWAHLQACQEYDLWGVPDYDEKDLEDQFEQRHDGLWGVYRFKRGFGGKVIRAAGAWDRVYLPPFYAFYRWWLKRQGASF